MIVTSISLIIIITLSCGCISNGLTPYNQSNINIEKIPNDKLDEKNKELKHISDELVTANKELVQLKNQVNKTNNLNKRNQMIVDNAQYQIARTSPNLNYLIQYINAHEQSLSNETNITKYKVTINNTKHNMDKVQKNLSTFH